MTISTTLTSGLLALALCGLLLGACGFPQSRSNGGGFAARADPAPLPLRRPAVPANFEALAARSDSAFAEGPVITGPYRVQTGDTVHSIANSFGVPLRVLIDANGLTPPYELQVGQTLLVPQPRTHLVAGGDTVYGISRRYGVDMAELARLNALSDPYRIVPGQALVIPGPGTNRVIEPAAVTVAELSEPSIEAAPSNDVEPPVDVREPGPPVAPADADVPPLEGSTSDALVVDPNAPPFPARRPGSEPVGETIARAPSTAGSGAAPAPSGSTAPAPAQSANPSKSASKAIPKPPARQGGKFLWPVNGQVIDRYGPRAGGLHNDGINIAAPRGSAIHASENGVVAYAGNELRGFGNLVLIKHSDGWVTAYAHAETLLVSPGQFVTRGDPIARVGSSGNVSQPQLHFEIRKGTRAVNPEDLLGPRLSASQLETTSTG